MKRGVLVIFGIWPLIVRAFQVFCLCDRIKHGFAGLPCLTLGLNLKGKEEQRRCTGHRKWGFWAL